MADFTTKQRQESNFIIYYSSLFLTHCPQSQCRPVQSDFVELTAELNRVVAEEEDRTWMKVRAMESH
jgi:hypothetical protein